MTKLTRQGIRDLNGMGCKPVQTNSTDKLVATRLCEHEDWECFGKYGIDQCVGCGITDGCDHKDSR